jgi:hypothetical protein
VAPGEAAAILQETNLEIVIEEIVIELTESDNCAD